jgi:hypothetical protein
MKELLISARNVIDHIDLRVLPEGNRAEIQSLVADIDKALAAPPKPKPAPRPRKVAKKKP